MLAVASPLMAAVAVDVLVAWLIVLAGVVHLVVALHSREAGSVIWRLLVGLAYLFFGGYLIARPVAGVASLTLLLASLFLVEGILTSSVFPGSLHPAIQLVSARRYRDVASGAHDLYAVAVEFRL